MRFSTAEARTRPEDDLLVLVQVTAESSIIFLMSTTKPSSCGQVKPPGHVQPAASSQHDGLD